MTFPTLQEDYKASHELCVVPWAEVPNAIYVQRTFKNGHNCVLLLKDYLICYKKIVPRLHAC